MKKIIGILLLLISSNSLACDVCGCSAGAFSQGMLNTGRSTIFGIRNTHRWFHSVDPMDPTRMTTTDENFNTIEVFGRFNFGKRFQVGAFIPYVVNQQKVSADYTKVLHGLSDVVLLGDYIFVNTIDSIKANTKWFGSVGLGLKTPTGRSVEPTWPEPNMLPGTGSWDLNAHANILVQFPNKFGLQHESAFTYKTANKSNYRFGNALSISQVVYYQYKINDNWKLVPQIGFNYQHTGKTTENGLIPDDSFAGGSLLNGITTVNLFYKNWTFNIQGFIPVYQKLSQGFVTQKLMLRTGIIYTLKSKK